MMLWTNAEVADPVLGHAIVVNPEALAYVRLRLARTPTWNVWIIAVGVITNTVEDEDRVQIAGGIEQIGLDTTFLRNDRAL